MPKMPRPPKQRDEAREHLQRDVAGQHVGEQTHAVRDRPRQERQHLDEHDQRQDVDRDALRHEQTEEAKPVLVEAVDQHRDEHEQSQRRGDDDVARHREGVGDEPDDVRDQNEHEQREHQREELHALLAGGAVDRVGDELVGQFRDRLHPAGDERPRRTAADQQRPDADHGDRHEQRGIGEGDLVPADVAQRGDLVDFELMNWIGHRRKLPELSP